jgi:hypothetical protein
MENETAKTCSLIGSMTAYIYIYIFFSFVTTTFLDFP